MVFQKQAEENLRFIHMLPLCKQDGIVTVNDRLSYHQFPILFLLLQEKNQKKQAKGMLSQLLPQLKPLPLETLGPHRHRLWSTLT